MQKLFSWIPENWRWVPFSLLVTALVAGLGFGYKIFFYKPPQAPPPPPPAKKEEPKPTTLPSPLTGVEVAPELAEKPIVAMVIENSPNARPQSGLGDAGVVYEAVAEGGITRYLAFYLENRPATLGPVRSLRTYFVSWALEFNAPVGHVGGNIDALDLVGPLGMKDIDQFRWGKYYYRTRDRYAPHNMYIDNGPLNDLLKAAGFAGKADFKPSPRKKDEPSAGSGKPIQVNFSFGGYQTEYTYDPAQNNYLRKLAGRPDIDRLTNQQIRVKNIVVQFMPTSYGKTRIGEQTVIMQTVGEGRAVVFRDGKAIEGKWKKNAHKERTILVDQSGAEIPLNAGNTWYSIVPTDKSVTY